MKPSNWLPRLKQSYRDARKSRIVKFVAHPYVHVPALLLLAALLMLHKIGVWSVWHDESFTTLLISYDYSELLRRAKLDVHPPLYYLVLKPYAEVFGSTETALRSFSVITMLGTYGFMYAILRKVFDKTVAGWGLFFLAIAPFTLRYAQEARMYGLAALGIAAATYCLVLQIHAKRQKWWLWAVYAASVLIAVYSHYYAFFVLPAHVLYIGVKLPWTKIVASGWKKGFKAFWKSLPKGWLLAIGVAAIAYLPWLPIAIDQFQAVQTGFWISPVDHRTFLDTLGYFWFYQPPWDITGWWSVLLLTMAVSYIVLLVLAFKRLPNKRSDLVLLTAYAFGSPLLIYLLSLPPLQPLYHVRYFSLGAIAFFGLHGLLVVSSWRVGQRAVATGFGLLITIGMLVGISNVYRVGNYNFDKLEEYRMRELSAVMNQNFSTGDAIVATDLFTYFDLTYYNDQSSTVQMYTPTDYTGGGNTALLYDREDVIVNDLNDVNPPTGRVWLSTLKDEANTPELPANWQLASPRFVLGHAALELYEITDGGAAER